MPTASSALNGQRGARVSDCVRVQVGIGIAAVDRVSACHSVKCELAGEQVKVRAGASLRRGDRKSVGAWCGAKSIESASEGAEVARGDVDRRARNEFHRGARVGGKSSPRLRARA